MCRAKLKLELAELAHAELERTTERQTEKIELEYARKKEDYDYALKVKIPNAEKNAKKLYESAQYRLEYSEEEYQQLQKMYKADDLTEETEEIILKRTKRAVERAKYSLQEAKRTMDWTLNTKLMREKADLESSITAALSEKEFALKKLTLVLQQSREAVERERLEYQDWLNYVHQLEQDLKSCSVNSPLDGVLYYGSFENGRWSSAAVQKMLVKGGKSPF